MFCVPADFETFQVIYHHSRTVKKSKKRSHKKSKKSQCIVSWLLLMSSLSEILTGEGILKLRNCYFLGCFDNSYFFLKNFDFQNSIHIFSFNLVFLVIVCQPQRTAKTVIWKFFSSWTIRGSFFLFFLFSTDCIAITFKFDSVIIPINSWYSQLLRALLKIPFSIIIWDLKVIFLFLSTILLLFTLFRPSISSFLPF